MRSICATVFVLLVGCAPPEAEAPTCTPADAGDDVELDIAQGTLTEVRVQDTLFTPPDGCVAPAELGAITNESDFRSKFACAGPSGVDFGFRGLYVVVVEDGELPAWTARGLGVLHTGIRSACDGALAGVVFLTEVDESVRVHQCACN